MDAAPLTHVAPLAGAWIETMPGFAANAPAIVAPLAGAWIETPGTGGSTLVYGVAPLAGAWIETNAAQNTASINAKSRPSRARGLKRPWSQSHQHRAHVAPLAGAWIETAYAVLKPL